MREHSDETPSVTEQYVQDITIHSAHANPASTRRLRRNERFYESIIESEKISIFNDDLRTSFISLQSPSVERTNISAHNDGSVFAEVKEPLTT